MASITENTFGLFPWSDFTLPEGNYAIKNSKDRISSLSCNSVFLLRKVHYGAFEESQRFYKRLASSNDNRYPFEENEGIIVSERRFTTVLKRFCKQNKNLSSALFKLSTPCYRLCISEKLDYNDNEFPEIITFVKSIRGNEEGVKKQKKTFFSIVNEFYNYITILRSPYINITDFAFVDLTGIFSYFSNTEGKMLTNILPFRFDYWEPKFTLKQIKQTKAFFETGEDIALEDLFLAKAKAYSRLHNYSMAIVHAVIALEVIIPRFINGYLKSSGVDSNAVQDFNNKFGLSVRVKVILRLILSEKEHEWISNVGAIIKYRNKIMHEGKTNDYFDNIDVDKLIGDCDNLIRTLKKRTNKAKKKSKSMSEQ